MNLTHLSDNTLLIEQHMQRSRNILRESCSGLTAEQQSIVQGIYHDLRPLIEASLSPDQIQQLFKGVEQGASAAGSNRTLLGKGADAVRAGAAAVKDVAGKGVDAVKKANEIINTIGQRLQDTAPVRAFDAKFEKLKNDINTKFPDSKILDGMSKLAVLAKENPGKTAAIMGVLTALAALATGPVGGAIAGQVLRGSLELLKGEKLSTAVGKGLKTAAVGALAGVTMDAVGDMVTSAYQQFNPIPLEADANFSSMSVGYGMPDTMQNAALYGTEEQLDQFKGMWKDAVDKWRSGDFAGAEQAFEQAKEFAAQTSADTMNQIAIEGDPAEKIQALNQAMDMLSAAAQGAASGATAFDKQGKPVTDNASAAKQENKIYKSARPLSEGQVYLVFNRVCSVNESKLTEGVLEEAPLDALKGFAAKSMDKLKTVGKNITTKVTADKLNSAWQKAGSPTDSEALAKFLTTQGVNSGVVDTVYQSLKIPKATTASTPPADADKVAGAGAEPATTAAPATGAQSAAVEPGVTYAQVKAQIEKLDKKGRQRLMTYLNKQMRTA